MNRSRLPLSTVERAVSARVAGGTFQPTVHAGFALCMLAFVALYAGTYVALAQTWANTGTFQYAFLIFPISAVLAWARRGWLARVAARPRPAALWAVAALGVLWLLGSAANINLARHIAAVAIWPVMVYAFYGPRVAAVLAFALGYLLFAVPFGDFLVEPLQTVTAHMSVYALKLTGVPVLMDGHFIDTPVTTWHVAEACSGIKFFVATAAFGTLYAYLFFTSLRRRSIFICCALVAPIIANGLRVYFTILIGEHFGLEYATGTDHLIFGWQFFGTVLILLFVCGWFWQQPPAEGPIPDMGLPENGSKPMRWMIPATLALVVIPVAWYTATGQMVSGGDASGPHALPAQLAGYAAVAGGADGDRPPPERGADVHLSRHYGDAMQSIRVDYLGVDAGSPDTDIGNVRHRFYDPSAWQVASRQPTIVRAQPGGPEFKALTLKSVYRDDARILLYAYRVGSRWFVSPLRFEFWVSFNRLLGRSMPVGILAVSGGAEWTSAQLLEAAAAAAHALQ